MIAPSQYSSLSISDAIAMQHELRKHISIQPINRKIQSIGGADISFDKYTEIVHAGIIVMSYPDLVELERVSVVSSTSFPYIPGLLAFREVPALLEAWAKLKSKPDLMVLDGQGITHERNTGIATHFGLLTDIPSIGCAKSSLWGKFMEPENKILAHSPIFDKDQLMGFVLRTKKNCKPVFISPGHNISVHESLEIITACVKGYRIPEPTRKAHLLVNMERINYSYNSSQLKLF